MGKKKKSIKILFQLELFAITETHVNPAHFKLYTVITLNIGTPRPATAVVLKIKQFNFTLK